MKKSWLLLFSMLLLTSFSTSSTSNSYWEELETKYVYYEWQIYDRSFFEETITVTNITILENSINYTIVTYDMEEDDFDTDYVNVTLNENGDLSYFRYWTNNLSSYLDEEYSLPLDFVDIIFHYQQLLFLPLEHPLFALKKNYDSKVNFTLEKSYTICNKSTFGYFIRIEYPTELYLFTKEYMFSDKGELLYFYFKRETIEGSRVVSLWEFEVTLLDYCPNATYTGRIPRANFDLIGIFVLILIPLVRIRKKTFFL